MELRAGWRYWCLTAAFDMRRPEGRYRTSGEGAPIPFEEGSRPADSSQGTKETECSANGLISVGRSVVGLRHGDNQVAINSPAGSGEEPGSRRRERTECCVCPADGWSVKLECCGYCRRCSAACFAGLADFPSTRPQDIHCIQPFKPARRRVEPRGSS